MRRWLVGALVVGGLWQVGLGLWIPAKAALAQALLERAWDHVLAGETEARPWPWADTWPVAKLGLPDEELIVLAGASGEALAFGPAYLPATAAPGAPGISVLAAHRDTHFRHLADLRAGDAVTITRPDGTIRRYRVRGTEVLDQPMLALPAAVAGSHLVLVTCWPPDAALPGGDERYAVWAEAVID